jgi:hypothetical protein
VPLRTLHLLTALLAAVLVPGLALAGGAAETPVQVVDGYVVTLSLPADRVQTGPNDVAVTLRAADGTAIGDASVSVAVVAYAAEGGHGDSHGDIPASSEEGAASDTHGTAPSDSHSNDHVAGVSPAAAPAADHGSTAGDGHEASSADSHGDDHAADGQGHEAIPTMLESGAEPGEYRGVLHFDEPGTATVTVAFTVGGEERAALFAVPVVQARPRALVLGGFAVINGLAIVTAAVLKRRMPQKQQRPKAPAPRTTVIPLTATTTDSDEERPA